MIERVEKVLEKHGQIPPMRDPDLELIGDLPVELQVQRFKAGRPRLGQYEDRTPEQLRLDITRVTDISLSVIKERDKLVRDKQSAEIAAGNRLTWVQILSTAAGVELLIIGFFAAQFFARLK